MNATNHFCLTGCPGLTHVSFQRNHVPLLPFKQYKQKIIAVRRNVPRAYSGSSQRRARQSSRPPPLDSPLGSAAQNDNDPTEM